MSKWIHIVNKQLSFFKKCKQTANLFVVQTGHGPRPLFRKYATLVGKLGLKMVVEEATRVTPKTEHLLDHILLNDLMKEKWSKNASVLDLQIADHQIVLGQWH